MDIYQAKGRTDALMSAAKNTGSVGGFMGAGIGMGMGAQMGQEFSKANTDAVYCPNCNHKLGFFDLFPVLSYIIHKESNYHALLHQHTHTHTHTHTQSH